MDKCLEEKINKQAEQIIESYNDEEIKTEHNYNVLRRKIAKEKYDIDLKEF